MDRWLRIRPRLGEICQDSDCAGARGKEYKARDEAAARAEVGDGQVDLDGHGDSAMADGAEPSAPVQEDDRVQTAPLDPFLLSNLAAVSATLPFDLLNHKPNTRLQVMTAYIEDYARAERVYQLALRRRPSQATTGQFSREVDRISEHVEANEWKPWCLFACWLDQCEIESAESLEADEVYVQERKLHEQLLDLALQYKCHKKQQLVTHWQHTRSEAFDKGALEKELQGLHDLVEVDCKEWGCLGLDGFAEETGEGHDSFEEL